MSAFQDLAALPAQQLSPGCLARAIHGRGVTFAVVEIEPHAELPEHSHENEQLGIVIRGSVTFRVGDEENTLEPGGTWNIPTGTPHFVRGGPDGAVVLDIFAPTREEWKRLDMIAPVSPAWP
jgi:quercetin dioxygenase-like cupin family protein